MKVNTSTLLEKFINGESLSTKELGVLAEDLNELESTLSGKGFYFKQTFNFVMQYVDNVNNCLSARILKRDLLHNKSLTDNS